MQNDTQLAGMRNDHHRLKAKCFTCGLHFIVCTWEREKHSKDTLHCPECGQHEGLFLTWLEAVAEPIYQIVPGESPLTADYEGEQKTITVDELNKLLGDGQDQDDR